MMNDAPAMPHHADREELARRLEVRADAFRALGFNAVEIAQLIRSTIEDPRMTDQAPELLFKCSLNGCQNTNNGCPICKTGDFTRPRAALTRPTPAERPVDPLENLVAQFAKRLLAKLKLAQANGRSGWERDDWETACQEGLLRHLEKGDPRDVAAYCAFMDHHGWVTKAPAAERPVPQVREALPPDIDAWIETIDSEKSRQVVMWRERALKGEAALTARPSDALTGADAWDNLVNKDDRTSPEEYPDMALITREELIGYMERAMTERPSDATEGADTISLPRWWLELCRDQLFAMGKLPPGDLGNWVFLFREQLRDAIERRLAPDGTLIAPEKNVLRSQPEPASEKECGKARRWKHRKRGSTYIEVGRGKLQSFDPGGLCDMQELVIYRSESDGSIWARPEDEFEDGRFEELPAPPAASLIAKGEVCCMGDAMRNVYAAAHLYLTDDPGTK